MLLLLLLPTVLVTCQSLHIKYANIQSDVPNPTVDDPTLHLSNQKWPGRDLLPINSMFFFFFYCLKSNLFITNLVLYLHEVSLVTRGL